MRLSEAVRLGSLAIQKPVPGEIDKCAIGMSLKAVGQHFDIDHSKCGSFDVADVLYTRFVTEWPWTQEIPRQKCANCDLFMYGTWAIWHRFDEHVMGDKSMTIEQLADFIASIEPPEDAATGEDYGDLSTHLLRRRGQDTSAPGIGQDSQMQHDGSTFETLAALVESMEGK